MRNPFSRHWLAVAAPWAVFGCAAGYFAVESGWAAWLSIAFSTLFLALLAVRLISKKPSYLALRGLFALLGFLWFVIRILPFEQQQPNDGKVVGRVCAMPEVSESGSYLVLDDAWIETAGGWERAAGRVSVWTEIQDAEYGDTIFAEANLKKPETSRNPGGWDNRKGCYSEGVSLTGTAEKGTAEVALQGGFSPLGGLYSLRKSADAAIESAAGKENGQMLTGVLFGDVSSLDFETLDDFRLSGIAHLLSVSGLHVSALAGAILWLFRKRRMKKRVLFITAPAVFCFCAMAGFSIPVVRAALCLLYATARRIRGEQADLRLNLSFAALVQCAVNPACVLSAGFAMSYGAVLGIALLFWRFRKLLADRLPKKPVFERAADVLALSAAAQLGVLPASLAFFGMLPLLSVIWNVLAVPLTGIAVFLGLFGGLLGAVFLPLGIPFIVPAGWLCALTRTIATIGGSIPFSAVAVGGGSALTAAGLILAAFALTPFIKKRAARLSAFALSAGLIAASAFIWSNNNAGLVVTMLDVGQSESILITCGGHAVLLDGGERNDYTDKGASVVLPYLRYMGIRSLDAAIASHSDSDHAGGLLRVCGRMDVGALLLSGTEGDGGFMELLDCANERGIMVQTLIEKDRIILGEAELTVLCAGTGGENEDSLVFLLSYGNFRALFTGDSGFDEEACFADSAGKVTLLKVGHHGSKYSTSEELLDITRPEIAIISAGVGNRYGFPSPETTERLEASGAETFVTAESGAVTVRVKGDRVTVETMLP